MTCQSTSSTTKLKARVRELTRRTRGRRLSDIVAELRETLLGWKAYFGIAEVLRPLRDIDKWIRRKLRCYICKQWGRAGYRELRKRGVTVREAWNTSKSAHGPWRHGISEVWDYRLLQRGRSYIHRTAACVIRTHGGVGGWGREASSYPD